MKRSNVSNVDASAKGTNHAFNKSRFNPKAFSNDCKKEIFGF